MKVALISYQWGEICLRLAGGLAEDDEVMLFLADDQARPHHDLLDPRVSFHPFAKPRLRHPHRQFRVIRQMLAAIEDFDPDVVHIQHGHLWLNGALHRLRHRPLVVTIHDPRHHLGDRSSARTPQRVLDHGFRRATEVIVHTEAMAEETAAHVGISRDRIHVIPLVGLGDSSDQASIGEVPDRVLFFGRIWPYKGLEYFVRAAPLVARAVPGASFVIAGQGDDIEPVLAEIEEPERFTVHNRYVSHEFRTQLFRESSVLALPYVEATQSGIIPLAATFERPVVASAVGGLPEQIDDGVTGLLVPPRDVEALASAIIELLEDPERRRAMGRAAHQKARAEWSATGIADRTRAVYRAAIDRGPAVERRRTSG